ncbi:hypothetical protein LTR09_005964 [Extremus antarcticus]|uniref:Uncharacterized protein n=1 Tax=Extremus antarcticus TaxID=702011 RepID=A0AAJ0GBX3_9PEZI|nr:hypothetical protein LTR09_005964 [Extremus antarcticus]
MSDTDLNASTIGKGLDLLENFQQLVLEHRGRKTSPVGSSTQHRSTSRSSIQQKQSKTEEGLASSPSSRGSTSRPSSARSELRPHDSVSQRNSPDGPPIPVVSDEQIEATRKKGRTQIIAHALTLIRLTIVRMIIADFDNDNIDVGDEQARSPLADEKSTATLAGMYTDADDLILSLHQDEEERVMDHLTAKIVFDPTWTMAAEGITLRLAKDLDKECDKLVKYWQRAESPET